MPCASSVPTGRRSVWLRRGTSSPISIQFKRESRRSPVRLRARRGLIGTSVAGSFAASWLGWDRRSVGRVGREPARRLVHVRARQLVSRFLLDQGDLGAAFL